MQGDQGAMSIREDQLTWGIANLSLGFRGENNIRVSASCHRGIQSGMDVGIVNMNPKEMIALDYLESDLKVLCENFVLKKLPEPTEPMLERTTMEKELMELAKRGGGDWPGLALAWIPKQCQGSSH